MTLTPSNFQAMGFLLPRLWEKGGFSQVISWVQNVIGKTRPYTPRFNISLP